MTLEIKNTTADREKAWLEIIYHCAPLRSNNKKVLVGTCVGSSVSLNRTSHDHKLTVRTPNSKICFFQLQFTPITDRIVSCV
jgi:hypothetical protein